MKLSQSASGILSARYRVVLILCALANSALTSASAQAAPSVTDPFFNIPGVTNPFLNMPTFKSLLIQDLKDSKVYINPVVEQAAEILDLDYEYLIKLTDNQQDAFDRVDDLLYELDEAPKKQYQVLREIAPDLSKSGIHVASNIAKNIINAASARFNASTVPQFPSYQNHYRRGLYGRSGGEYNAESGSVWVQGLFNHAEKSGKESFSANSAGFAAGVEACSPDGFKAGIGYSFAATSIDTDRSQNDAKTHTAFVYAGFQPENFYANFFGGFGHSSYDDTTKTAKLESEYQINTVSTQIAVGYSAPVLSPEIAFRFIGSHEKAYTDALGVEFESKNSTAATAIGGLKLSNRYRLRSAKATSFIPELKAAVTYDFARSTPNKTAFLPNGSSYIVETDTDKRLGAEASAGFSLNFKGSGSLAVMYDGAFQGRLQSHSIALNVKIYL